MIGGSARAGATDRRGYAPSDSPARYPPRFIIGGSARAAPPDTPHRVSGEPSRRSPRYPPPRFGGALAPLPPLPPPRFGGALAPLPPLPPPRFGGAIESQTFAVRFVRRARALGSAPARAGSRRCWGSCASRPRSG